MQAPPQNSPQTGTAPQHEIPPAGGWEAAGEIALVILPYLATVALGRFFGLIYLGPVAVLAGVAIATFLLHRKGRRWHDLGFRRPRSWRWTFLGAAGLYLALMATVALLVMPLVDALELGRPDVGRLLIVRQSLLAYLIFLGPISWGTAAFGEELIARGFILNRLAEALGATRMARILSVLGQGLIFGVAHWYQGFGGVIVVTIVAVLLGFAYLKAGRNLWVTIITHGIVDSVAVTALYFGPDPGP